MRSQPANHAYLSAFGGIRLFFLHMLPDMYHGLLVFLTKLILTLHENNPIFRSKLKVLRKYELFLEAEDLQCFLIFLLG